MARQVRGLAAGGQPLVAIGVQHGARGGGGQVGHHVVLVAGGPGGGVGAADAVPHGRRGLLQRLQLHRHVPEGVERPLEVHAVVGELAHQNGERLGVLGIGWVGDVHPVDGQLVGRGALAHAELEAAAAHVVEHADLFVEPERVIEHQGIDQRPEPQAPGLLGHRGQEHAGRRRHAQRRGVVFGQMVHVEAGLIIGCDQLEAVGVLLGRRDARAVHMIENAEFHMLIAGPPRPTPFAPHFCSGAVGRLEMWPGISQPIIHIGSCHLPHWCDKIGSPRGLSI